MIRKPADTRIHFVGIGGIGMSGIAEVLLNLGYAVSGSDLKESDLTRRLGALGGRIERGHAAAHVRDADVVVTSSAVRRDNPEVVEARRRKVPVIPRAEMLAELMRLKQGVAIAGSHGKTTTTSMAAHVMARAGLDPTAVVGGKVNAFGSNAKLGKGSWIVVEADESDGSFLHYTPTLVLVTNIDPEHLDHWKTEEALRQGFVDFANRVPFYGSAVLCLDHPGVRSILPRVDKRVVTYGESPEADYRATRIEVRGPRVAFEATRRGEPLGRFEVHMVGRHNALNALGVVAIADEMGIPTSAAREALSSFEGVQRRFTVRGEARGVTVVDDYGHHPAEVKATLAGARRAFGRRIVVAFQPHRYTRTHHLFAELVRAFNRADVLFVTDVYAAGEAPIAAADGRALAEAVQAAGKPAPVFVEDVAGIPEAIRPAGKAGDVVLTMGAGSIGSVAGQLGNVAGQPSP